MTMTNNEISGGVVHELPEDLRKTLASDAEALAVMGGSYASCAQ